MQWPNTHSVSFSESVDVGEWYSPVSGSSSSETLLLLLLLVSSPPPCTLASQVGEWRVAAGSPSLVTVVPSWEASLSRNRLSICSKWFVYSSLGALASGSYTQHPRLQLVNTDLWRWWNTKAQHITVVFLWTISLTTSAGDRWATMHAVVWVCLLLRTSHWKSLTLSSSEYAIRVCSISFTCRWSRVYSWTSVCVDIYICLCLEMKYCSWEYMI